MGVNIFGDHDRLVIADEPGRELVQEILPPVGDPGMDPYAALARDFFRDLNRGSGPASARIGRRRTAGAAAPAGAGRGIPR